MAIAALLCHVIVIWAVGNPFKFMIGCQVSHDHVTTIFKLLCRLPQKINGEAGKESCMLLLPAKGVAEKRFWHWEFSAFLMDFSMVLFQPDPR